MGNARSHLKLAAFGSEIIDVQPIFRMLWGAIFLVIALKLFFWWWNSPKRKGARGEKLVAGRLRKGLPGEYLILNDIYLPLPDGTTTQIDHVVVSQIQPRRQSQEAPFCG